MSLIAVVCGKGSPGATFISINLAKALAEAGVDPLLMDLDPHGGDLAGYLGLDPRRGLHPLRLLGNGTYSPEALLAEVQERSSVSCITGFPRAADADPSVIAEIVAAARVIRRLVVADVGRIGAKQTPVLEAADLVIVVVRPDLVSIHGAERAVETLLKDGIERECLAVAVNGWGWLHAADAAETAPALGLVGLGTIPLDRRAARKSLRAQTPLSGGRAARAFHRLADQVLKRLDEVAAVREMSVR